MAESVAISDREKMLCKHFDVPLPKTSRLERMRALMATRNEWKLYRRKCDFTGDEIISAYTPNSPFKVYKNEVWWGSDWDALEYGRDFDFNRPFFEQFSELQRVVPREGTSVFSCENCDYNSHIRESKNCYLNSLVYQCDDLYYSYWMVHDKNVFDSACTNESTLCYNCIAVNNGYQCIMVEESENCSDCHFSYQLRGCDHCLFCSNLANKSYHIFNKPCSEEEFENMKNKYLHGSWTDWKDGIDHYLGIRKETVHRFAHNINCENCLGDHLYNCRDLEDCFESFDSEDGVNAISLDRSKIVANVYSAGWPGCEGVYMSTVIRGSKDVAFCKYTWFSGSMRYCDSCNSCDSCFGCIGLHHKKYCILNKQYSREEYVELTQRIKKHMMETGEWGEFFPHSLSPFGYNESIAQDFFPLSKDEALERGFNWSNFEPNPPKAKKNIPASKLPDNTEDIPDDVLNWAIVCETCGKPFKMISQELTFYRQFRLPAPHSCSICRHRVRFNLRNSPILYSRVCDKCGKDIRTSYSPDRPEKVYCENCYLSQVY